MSLIHNFLFVKSSLALLHRDKVNVLNEVHKKEAEALEWLSCLTPEAQYWQRPNEMRCSVNLIIVPFPLPSLQGIS